jgi:outer membrane protein assembly factor BamA
MVEHSFKTKAFNINYNGQWMQAIGKADITLNALVDAPDNTMNFFGQGNNTVLDKTGDYHTYYRTRFDFYQLDPALRWHTGKGSTISLGPSFQFYHFDVNGNTGRSINQPGLIKSYDSTSFDKNKSHAGFIADYISDKKDNKILPTKGFYLNVKLEGYAGLNASSKSFMQIRPEFTYFQKVDSGARLVLSDRIGGGASVGHPAFYQYMFLGGQGNLLGYLQNRFSGQEMAYNNFQARFRIANIGGYILPGQLGITGFYDVGRVWIDGEHTGVWHQGTGGGLYFAPATMTVIQVIAGHSKEGWYPYIAFDFRL